MFVVSWPLGHRNCARWFNISRDDNHGLVRHSAGWLTTGHGFRVIDDQRKIVRVRTAALGCEPILHALLGTKRKFLAVRQTKAGNRCGIHNQAVFTGRHAPRLDRAVLAVYRDNADGVAVQIRMCVQTAVNDAVPVMRTTCKQRSARFRWLTIELYSSFSPVIGASDSAHRAASLRPS